ncbi:hypothetical protein [Desulfolithobacter sp.]
MKGRKDEYGDWEREFLEFIDADPVTPPAVLTEKLRATIGDDLRPVLWKIFAKLGGIQAVCATLTLFFCPQFEIGFTKHDHLAHLVQHTHGFGFMLVCGMIFLSGGAAIAPFFLKQAEVKAIERSVLVYFPTAAMLAVMVFYLVGADINWSLALPWFTGGTLGSVIGFGLVRHLRFRNHHSLLS